MIYLLTAIVSMSLIMLALKFFNVRKIYIPQVIMTNYLLAFCIAAIGGHDAIAGFDFSAGPSAWLFLAPLTGLLYFSSMDIMAASTRRAGVSLTTMASRTSVVLPVLWAATVLGEPVSGWEVLGMVLVLTAFFLIIWQPRGETRNGGIGSVLLPVCVFLSVGFIAVCMKTSQHLIKTTGDYASDYPVFEALLFAAAAIGSSLWYGLREGAKAFRPQWRPILGGLCLGTFNYFVTYGMMNGLKHMSSSVFYGVYNIAVVVLTSIVGVLVFRERLTRRQTAGIAVAVAAIMVLGFFGGSL